MDMMNFMLDMPLLNLFDFIENSLPVPADDLIDSLLAQVYGDTEEAGHCRVNRYCHDTYPLYFYLFWEKDMESIIGPSSIQIREGITYFNGRSHFLNSTDYPYFRDNSQNWADRLDKIKALGHEVVACYIPWRHHEIEIDGVRRFDFNGETCPNRDVIGFLKLCQEKGLKVIAKPGPFVHAELNYGGLPNWVCPSFNPAIEAMMGASGMPFSWGGIQLKADQAGMEELPLPAPFDPAFLSEVERWLRTVTERVIAPFAGPEGPIVMVQIANEGIYSNYQRAPWAYDYSRSSLQHIHSIPPGHL